MKIRTRNTLLASAMALTPLMMASGGTAWAQEAPTAAEDETATRTPGVITVTARKRSESALDVPVAISAYSGEDLNALNVQTVEELTAITPGMNLNNSIAGSARSDRSQTALIIRGMAPSRGNRTSSTFINGVPISDGTVTGIFDFDHVEVLKGPQSAYFGRQTFAGAINMVTAQPTDYFTGYVSALGGSRDYLDLRGAVGGPIVPGVLSFRASGRYFTRDGSWKNNAMPGEMLGDQSTRSGSLQLDFTPTDNLSVKLFGMIAHDDDGAGATGVLLPEQANCEIGGNPFFCGQLPNLLPGQPSANTEITPGLQEMFANYSPIMSQDENIDHYGMVRDSNHFSATVEYVTDSGISLTSMTGLNRNSWTVLYPITGVASPYENTFTNDEFAMENTDWPFTIQHRQKDFSQEFRVSSDPDARLRWMAGGSYLWAKGYEGYAQLYFFSGLSSDFSSTSENETWGGFFGLSYDLTDTVTIDVDGRYQSDTIMSRDGATDVIGYEKTYNNFLPRVSVQYKPNPDLMLYATYSRGVNPGLGIDPLLSVPPEYAADLEAQGVTHGVKPEILDNFEAGFKGSLFNGRLIFAGDVYYDIWSDKITETTLLIPRPNETPLYVSVFTNQGRVDLKGIELEMTARPTDELTMFLAGAINDSTIKRGSCAFCQTMTGDGDATGNRLPFTSKYSLQGWAEYAVPVPSMGDYSVYGRGEFTYKSGVYASEGNYAKTDDAAVVNFRLGMRSDGLSFEGFVTNAFNNKTYTSVQPNWELANPAQSFATYDTMVVGLPQLRTWGFRVRYDF